MGRADSLRRSGFALGGCTFGCEGSGAGAGDGRGFGAASLVLSVESSDSLSLTVAPSDL